MPVNQALVNAAIAGTPLGPQGPGPAGIPGAPAPEFQQADRPLGGASALAQAALAIPPAEVTLKQRAMLGLIKEDPELQMKYLQRQGFESVIENNEVKVRGPSGDLVPFNPEGVDVGDFVEYLPEAVEGVVGAVATGAKVLGAIGAPVTGGGSLAAASALGGATTAATEAGKQGLAASLGLREGLDPARIARQGAIGAAVPPVLAGAGKAIGGAARGLGQAIFRGKGALPIDKEAIEASTELIGGRATPAQLSNNPITRVTESLLSKMRLGLGGIALRQQQRVNQVAAIEASEEILANRSNKLPEVIGDDFAEKVMTSISKKLAPATKLYGELDVSLKNVPADKKALQEGFASILESLRTSPEGIAALNKFKPIIDGLETVDDIKNFRTNIAREIGANASDNAKIAADKLYAMATKVRTSSYDNAINELKRIGEPGSEKGLQAMKQKLAEADRIWSETTKLAERALLAPGKKFTGGVEGGARKALFEGVKAEERVGKFLGSAQQAEALEQLSKEGFDEAASAKAFQIYSNSIGTGKGSQGRLLPQKVARELDKLSPSVAKQIFGDHGVKKAKALQTLWRAIPEDYNPSGTASTLDMIMFATGASQLSSMSLSALNILGRTPGFQAKAAMVPAFSKIADDIQKQRGANNASN
jgi:hypothetical protein